MVPAKDNIGKVKIYVDRSLSEVKIIAKFTYYSKWQYY